MKSKIGRICLILLISYLILGAAFYPIGGESLHQTHGCSDTVSPTVLVSDFTVGSVIEQDFVCNYDSLDQIGLRALQKSNSLVRFEILNEQKNVLYGKDLDLESLSYSEQIYLIPLEQPLKDAKDQTFTLRITSLPETTVKDPNFESTPDADAPARMLMLYCGNTVETGRFSVEAEMPAATLNQTVIQDGSNENVPVSLCMSIYGTDHHIFGQYYWYFYAGGALLLAAFLSLLLFKKKKQKKSVVLALAASLNKYRFLIKQLVMRDFKTKYKRSVLGMFWSFLNPLLTMSIQYIIFSTLFRSDIENFVVYLLTGIVCFNFFSEATNMCLMSIIGNASLINKVYVPKYIYPFSRTLSSGINLLLALIPLLLMLVITQKAIPITILLLPFVLLMLFFLSYGIGLILATLMVFFRDTQFLWSICVMLLNYLSPIFYPESIIPANFLPIYRMNPLYQVISFTRKILMIGDGICAPSPQDYVTCILACVIPFFLGLWIFKKNENKFVLNI